VFNRHDNDLIRFCDKKEKIGVRKIVPEL